MRSLCLLSLGLLLAAGCADTAEDYETNKPVINEPAPTTPAVEPVPDANSNMDATTESADESMDADNDAASTSATPDTNSATSGAVDTESSEDATQPVVP